MKKFALIGENIAYSISPRVHSLIFSHLEVKADYSLISLTRDELLENLDALKRLDGFNVTQPHKGNIIEFLDENYSPFNAVNAVRVEDGRLKGYNTDEYGFKTHISECIESLKGKRIVVLGAGGMAEIAVGSLTETGANVFIFNRTFEKAEKLAKEYGAAALKNADGFKPDAVVNCSSRGLYEYSYPLPSFDRQNLALAYDSIYLDTAFSRSMRAYGVKTVNGLRMLIYQAIKCDEIFLDIKIDEPKRLCDEIERQLLDEGI